MRLLPRSLLPRLLLLIALLLAVSIYASLKIFDYFDRGPRATTAAIQAVTIVNYTRASLIAAHESRRFALLSELAGREGVRIYVADFFEPINPLPNDSFLKLVAKKIKERLGAETIITVNHYADVPGLWISFNVGVDDFWVVIPNIQADRPFPWHWLGWGAIVLLLSLLGAYIITARISRPLKLLVHAAERLRNGEEAPKLPENSVYELTEVSRTFNEMAESLVRLDGERRLLLAGVSHDIRTPLARLRLAVEMLPDSEDYMKHGMIDDISDMDNIIHQFLDFVRGIEGEPTKMLDVNAMLNSLAERQSRAGQSLKLSLASTIFLPIRPLAMQRLLDNLVGNAYAYAKGKVEVRSMIKVDAVEISILDNGPGIPPGDAERLLRPFERMDSARNKNEGGSGLGLAICNRIAKLHHGKLELLNRPEGGLEARLTLPIQD